MPSLLSPHYRMELSPSSRRREYLRFLNLKSAIARIARHFKMWRKGWYTGWGSNIGHIIETVWVLMYLRRISGRGLTLGEGSL